MLENRYKENIDYLYIQKKLNIHDEYCKNILNNEIINNSKCVNVRFYGKNKHIQLPSNFTDEITIDVFGDNNSLIIENNCSFGKSFHIEIRNSSKIVIGKDNKFGENTHIISRDSSKIMVGQSNEFLAQGLILAQVNSCIELKKCLIFVYGYSISATVNAYVGIDSGGCFGAHTMITSNYYGHIRIGTGCLASWSVALLANDGHPIYDKSTNRQINTGHRNIIIDNDVWLGIKSSILADTYIGNDSVVGANSVVKGQFPSNCIVAGNIAKIVRENIYWRVCTEKEKTEFELWESRHNKINNY